MRYINLNSLLTQIFADDAGKKSRVRLRKAHIKVAGMTPANRKTHTDRNGPNKWKPVKDLAISVEGRKCWYTEVELIGAPLVVDHFRPICHYWWLAYDAENYRIACPWSNSPEPNPLYGCAGGKGDNFPLCAPGLRAKGKNKLRIEKPMILDPCNAEDCMLLAFQADGRPVLNPVFSGNAVALQRVEESKILLNLDHPTFNAEREKLRIIIEEEVRDHEALPEGSVQQTDKRNRIAARLGPKAPFSIAAYYYLSLHRHIDWVQQILDAT